jgi:heat shock protein HtpX
LANGLDEETRRAHARRNFFQSVLLLAGLGGVLSVSALLTFGWSGLVWGAASIALILLLAPRVAPETIMRMYRARPLDPRSADELNRILAVLTERANLKAAPRLYVIPNVTLNAFATGARGNAVIGVTQGLLQTLSLRELAGVLAHEISHIRNNDLWVMGLADAISRFTQVLSNMAVVLAFLNVVGMLGGVLYVSWLTVLLLYLAPLASSLLQLGLSRAREYDADLEAAELMGDPAALISALRKLERYTGRFWEDLMFPLPGRRVPQPSLLRSHPTTDDRVARLCELAPRTAPILVGLVGHGPQYFDLPPRYDNLSPRHRWPGVWF